jgi:hypothetical protein
MSLWLAKSSIAGIQNRQSKIVNRQMSSLKISLFLVSVVFFLSGCASSKNVADNAAPRWFQDAEKKSEAFQKSLTLIAPDSIRLKTIRVVADEKTKDSLDVFLGDALELAYAARLLRSYQQTELASALSAFAQGIESSKSNTNEMPFRERAVQQSRTQVMHLATRADSLTGACNQLFDKLDAEYQSKLNAASSWSNRDATWAMSHSRRMLSIAKSSAELSQFIVQHYKLSDEKLQGLSASANLPMEKMQSLVDARQTYMLRTIVDDSARAAKLNEFIKKSYQAVRQQNKRYWIEDAGVQYETLAKVYESAVSDLKNSLPK